jgi:hypothetical protein
MKTPRTKLASGSPRNRPAFRLDSLRSLTPLLLLATGCTNPADPEQFARPAALAVQAAEHEQPMVDTTPANDPATLDQTVERLPPERRSDHDHFDLFETVISQYRRKPDAAASDSPPTP